MARKQTRKYRLWRIIRDYLWSLPTSTENVGPYFLHRWWSWQPGTPRDQGELCCVTLYIDGSYALHVDGDDVGGEGMMYYLTALNGLGLRDTAGDDDLY